MVILIFTSSCSPRSNPKYHGELLVSGALDVSKPRTILSINLSNGEIKEQFSAKMGEVYFPVVFSGTMFFITNQEDKYSINILNKDKTINALLSLDQKIISFYVEDDSIYYIAGKEKDVYSLFMFDRSTKQILELYEGVDEKRRPIIGSQGEVFFVAERGDEYKILSINQAGVLNEIVNGRYPLFVAKEGYLLFEDSTNLYSLKGDEIRLLKKGLSLVSTPALSPEQEQIAFYHWDNQFDVTSSYLSIMDIETKLVSKIKAFGNIKRKATVLGLFWFGN